MRLQRFFLSKRNINEPAGTVAIDEPGLISQIRNVLRLHSGDRIVILDGEGGLFHCKLTDLARSGWDIHEIARMAGHRSIQSTLLYVHLSGADLAEKIARTMAELTEARLALLTGAGQ